MPLSPIPDVLFLRPTPHLGTSDPGTRSVVEQSPAESSSVELPDGPVRHGPKQVADRSTSPPSRSVRDVVSQLQGVAPESFVPQAPPASPSRTTALAPPSPDPPQWYTDFPVAPTMVGPHHRPQVLHSAAPTRQVPSPAPMASGSPHGSATIQPTEWPAIVQKLLQHDQRQWRALGDHVVTATSVGLVGIGPQCGTTSLAAALAKTLLQRTADGHDLAAKRRSILLLDANFSQPTMAPLFALDAVGGWNEWNPSTGPSHSRTLVGPDDLRVMPLTCGIVPKSHQRPATNNAEKAENSIRYYLPENAAIPIIKKLGETVAALKSANQTVLVDLGNIPFWDQIGQMPNSDVPLDHLILVVPRGCDARTISQIYWRLCDAHHRAITILENSK